jgi:hypothetical protein
MFLWKIGIYLPDYTTTHHKGPQVELQMFWKQNSLGIFRHKMGEVKLIWDVRLKNKEGIEMV